MSPSGRLVSALVSALTLIFALVVCGTASAASTTVEAESMTLGTGMEVRAGPPPHVALLANSGTNGLKKTVSTGALTQLTLQAWAKQPCTAWPVAQVFVDGVRVGGTGVVVNTTTSAAYNVPVSVAAGSHGIEVRFNNDGGNGSCDINLYLDKIVLTGPDPADTTPPTATLTAPTNGATVSGTVTLSATAQDNVGVDHVNFRDGTNTVGSDSTAPYSISWDSTTVADGSHSISARVFDAAGNTSLSNAAVVTVNNATPPPPTGRPFPRLALTKFVLTSTADAQAAGRFDWLMTTSQWPLTSVDLWPTVRQANPNIKISGHISGTEDNCCQTNNYAVCASPNQYDDPAVTNGGEWTDNWWLKNFDGTYPNMPGQSGRHMSNPTSYAPTNAAGERPNDHLSNWIARCLPTNTGGRGQHADGVTMDMTTDTSLYQQWPNWDLTVKIGSNMDLDRNGVRDVTEHGAAWVNNTWGAAMRDLVAKVRSKVGPDFIVITNSGNGTGFAPWSNGQMYEHGGTVANGVINDNEIAMFRQWEQSHFGESWSVMNSGSGSHASESNYGFMRHNLAAALVAGTWFGHSCAASCNYDSQPWYDEYSVNLATGVATGDASHKGYLGQPTGTAGKLANGVWRRDFDNGVVLLNNTSASQTVSLGGTFRRIRGTQDPTVNSGASVSSVTLAAQSGLVLIR